MIWDFPEGCIDALDRKSNLMHRLAMLSVSSRVECIDARMIPALRVRLTLK